MIDTAVLAFLLALAVSAALVSIKLGLSVAIVELVIGMLAGNMLGFSSSGHDWLLFLAGLGSVVLTFLAGAEIDPEAMRKNWKASISIGMLSFLAPFLGTMAICYLLLGWTWPASLLAGVALSTTSVAVVYVVLVETGTSRTETGKLILSACFVTDLGTVVALSLLFIHPNIYFLVMLAALVISILILPKFLNWMFTWLSGRMGEPEVKVCLLILVLLGLSAEIAGSHAVLPAYILGLILASTMAHHKAVLVKLRSLSMSFLTPFFFIAAGLNVSLFAVASSLGLVALLFAIKVGSKFIGILPPCRRFVGRDSIYITLLMSTGLTFGTISAQYGLSMGIIDRTQFSVLVTVVMLTAIVPTIIAQRWFKPGIQSECEKK